jgi:hypothetical protein
MLKSRTTWTDRQIKDIIQNRRRIECECNLTDSCASCYLYDDLLKDLQLNDKRRK